MPIRDSEKARYPADWPKISYSIRERAGWKCEECGVPNAALGGRDGGVFYRVIQSQRIPEAAREQLEHIRAARKAH